jgi:hypothetical protein
LIKIITIWISGFRVEIGGVRLRNSPGGRVQGLGFRVKVLGFRVQGSGSRV